jgi:hypothetical protein
VVRKFDCHVVKQKLILNRLTRGGGETLVKQNDIINDENAGLKNDKGSSKEHNDRKRPFVEPAISVPVDVLEATTFFQSASSGVTN